MQQETAGLRRRGEDSASNDPGGRTNVAPRYVAAGETVGARQSVASCWMPCRLVEGRVAESRANGVRVCARRIASPPAAIATRKEASYARP
jgi:hypothetical protein